MKKMELDLNKIRYKTYPYLIKSKGLFSDTYYDLTPDEEYFMSGMAPRCHSMYIANNYYLNVNIKYAACNYCCSAEPTQRIPLAILPRVNPSTYGFEAPQGYSSTELGQLKITLPDPLERKPFSVGDLLGGLSLFEGGNKSKADASQSQDDKSVSVDQSEELELQKHAK